MNEVQPIREFETIEDIMDYFKVRSERNYVMFCTGIYAPLRISDILKWKVRDVRNKEFIRLKEQKTNKERLFPVNDELKKILVDYIADKKDFEYLFQSRQRNKKGIYGPISRQQAYNILNQAAREFGLEMIGCHTLRKTFGYHYYKQFGDIVTLQEIYKHADVSITKRYIGLTKSIMTKAIKDFRYKKIRK